MSQDFPNASFKSTVIPRRISSSPDLRDSVHIISPPRAAHIHNDGHLTIRHSESSSTPSPTRLRISTPDPLDQHAIIESHSITDVRTKDHESSTVPPKSPTFSIPEPLPTWEDFPPLPGAANAGPFKFRYWWFHLRALFGYEGTRERKELIRLFWKLGFDSTQICISIAFLIISAKFASPKDSQITEWTACDQPLGIWQSVWVARLFCGFGISIWAYQRQRAARVLREQTQPTASPPNPDAEQNAIVSSATETDQPDNAPDSGQEAVTSNAGANTSSTPTEQPRLPFTTVYSRLTVFLTLASVVWWLVAQKFLYSSVQGCRFTSPHLYWLVFGSVCIGYIAVLEVFAVALLIFLVGPLILLFVNTIRLCLGREPVRPPTRINPTIGKLSKDSVARVPLVLYIPSPNAGTSGTKGEEKAESNHTYPPASAADSPITSEKPKIEHSLSSGGLFQWFQRTPRGQVFNFTANPAKRQKVLDGWDAQWEKGSYPFVRLSGSRATCHICLDEFEEPPKKGESKINQQGAEASAGNGKFQLPQRKGRRKTRKANSDDPLQLESVGEGPQPLRLLACGHVFHKSCIDPWLTDVSGRCPVCQLPVEVDGQFHQASRRTPTSPPSDPDPVEDHLPSNRGEGEDMFE